MTLLGTLRGGYVPPKFRAGEGAVHNWVIRFGRGSCDPKEKSITGRRPLRDGMALAGLSDPPPEGSVGLAKLSDFSSLHCRVTTGLLADAQLLDKLTVTLWILPLQVLKQAPPSADHRQQAAS